MKKKLKGKKFKKNCFTIYEDARFLTDELYDEMCNNYIDSNGEYPDCATEAYFLEEAELIAQEQVMEELSTAEVEEHIYEITGNLKSLENSKTDSKNNKLLASIIAILLTITVTATFGFDHVNAKTFEKINEEVGDYNYSELGSYKVYYNKNVIVEEIIAQNENIYLAFGHLYSELCSNNLNGNEIYDENNVKYTPEELLQVIFVMVNEKINFSQFQNFNDYLTNVQKQPGSFEKLHEDFLNYWKQMLKSTKNEIKKTILKKIRIKGEK